MDQPRFVYVIEIATSAEKLWAALTGNEFWRQFSGPVESDWKVGSPVKFFLADGTLHSEGVVLESSPPHVLSHTWPDPEGEQSPELAACLTWRIAASGTAAVKLTMVHEKLSEKNYQGVSRGWPALLNSLKTTLESQSAHEP